MKKQIIAIGGGEIRNKTTLDIDRVIATLAKERAKERRAVATFVGTASHDSMPYFNSFRKTYTSVFDIKADVALTVYGEMDYQKIKSKFDIADCIYIGGGDTKYMLDHWRNKDILKLILDAYERGVIIAGLSAGAVCWFDTMFTDYDIVRGQSNEYKILEGLGIVSGVACPHYNERQKEFEPVLMKNNFPVAYGIENDCALYILDGEVIGTISSGGKAFRITNNCGSLIKTEITTADI